VVTEAWLKSTAPGQDAVPGAVIAIQRFGDFLGFNPHCHILSTDACFCDTGGFQAAPVIVRKDLEEIFRHKVLKLLLSERKITEDLVRMLMSWRHSGFNVFSGPQIYPREGAAMDNLARYVIRASLSQKRTSCWRSTERGVKTQGEKWPRLHLFLLRLISPFIVIT